MEEHYNHQPYARLAGMTVLSFAAMYILMYAMVDAASSVFNNINQFYMAGLMAMPMVVIELALMRRMYPSATWPAPPEVRPRMSFESGYFQSLEWRRGHGTKGTNDRGDHRGLA